MLLKIQILIVLFVLYALTRTLWRFRSRMIGLGEWVLWSGFWAAVGVCVLLAN